MGERFSPTHLRAFPSPPEGEGIFRHKERVPEKLVGGEDVRRERCFGLKDEQVNSLRVVLVELMNSLDIHVVGLKTQPTFLLFALIYLGQLCCRWRGESVQRRRNP